MLSRKCRYAIQALHFMAENAHLRGIPTRMIADHKHLPKKFLEVILHDLRDAGLVTSKRGKGGGYTLAMSPSRISLAKVVLAMDRSLILLPCLKGRKKKNCSECQMTGYCFVRDSFQEIQTQLIRNLSTTTLMTILEKRRQREK